jgi:diguanylate cyclase (GGDEF)-like protein
LHPKYLVMDHDSYAGVDRGLATRMAAVFWVVEAVLVLTALPLTPPTDAIGDIGWAVAGASGLLSLAGAVALVRRGRAGYAALLAVGYVSVAQIALAQWLAGGITAPYRQLYILPVLGIVAVHPPRRIVPFFATLLAAAGAPLVYDGWAKGPAAAFILGALLWLGTAVITYRLMKVLRQKQVKSDREHDHAKRLARLDPLTGLNNRRAFDETLDEQIALARSTGQSLSVLLADIDGFKLINDEHGHMNGDSCLRQVARTIQVSVRATDACFRWGGDEFAVVLPNADAVRAAELCERIQVAVQASCFAPDGVPLQVSCGYTELSEGMDTRELLEAADLAMLTLKRSLAR